MLSKIEGLKSALIFSDNNRRDWITPSIHALRPSGHRRYAPMIKIDPVNFVEHVLIKSLPIKKSLMVGAIGFEPTTPTMSRWCSNQLSYAPEKSEREVYTGCIGGSILNIQS